MSLRKLCPVLFVAACGGGDDPPPIDGNELPPGCDFAELADATNNVPATAEATSLTFATSTVLCGTINETHFEPAQVPTDPGLVDLDVYSVTVGASSAVLLSLDAAGAEALLDVAVLAVDAQDNVVAAASFSDTHAILATGLDAGEFRFAVVAANLAAAAAPIDYKVRILADDRDGRCARAATTADVTEANDAPGDNNNDIMDVRFDPGPGQQPLALTANADDVPDNVTPLDVATGDKKRISGVHVDQNDGDEYRERDTFLIRTGANINQLTIRIDWEDTGVSDHDFMLFEDNKDPGAPAPVIPEFTNGTTISDVGEFQTFPVKPDTTYWLWTGTFDLQAEPVSPPTQAVLPSSYDISLCGETFAP